MSGLGYHLGELLPLNMFSLGIVPLGVVPLGSGPLGSVPFGSVPLGGIVPLGTFWHVIARLTFPS